MESGTCDIVAAKKVQALGSAVGKKTALLDRLFGICPDNFLG
jgi:hypothetical protein